MMLPTNVKEIATKFVDLALRYGNWKDVSKLPIEEITIISETLTAAGFEFTEIVHGRLYDYYRDQDGSCTGETFPINQLFPLKVKLGKDNQHLATGWLDCALRRVVFGSNFHKESRDKLVDAIATEIERSIPLNPIRLTPEGDYLSEYPPRIQHLGGLEYFVEHTRDGDDLDHCVGIHKYCGCFMDRRGATETHDAIVCRGCHLRVLFPKTVKTYGELRQALSHK